MTEETLETGRLVGTILMAGALEYQKVCARQRALIEELAWDGKGRDYARGSAIWQGKITVLATACELTQEQIDVLTGPL